MVLLLAGALVLQFRLRRYVPAAYWLVVVLVSIVGTLLTDKLTDDLGVPLEVTTLAFALALAITFAFWHKAERTLSIRTIYTPRREAFYWTAVLATFALGTAAGDLLLESLREALGEMPSLDDPSVLVPAHPQAALLLSAGFFALVIALSALGHLVFRLNAVLMFWVAYVFTRPLGANLGDYLSLDPDEGGLGLGPQLTSALFLAAILACIVYLTVTKKDTSPDPHFIVETQGEADRHAKG
jgi:uncharacterized membrane-anchored protein